MHLLHTGMEFLAHYHTRHPLAQGPDFILRPTIQYWE